LQVTVSNGEALYNQNSLIQAQQLGAVQIAAPGLGLFTGTFPKLTVLGLPYLLPSPEAIRAAVEAPDIGGVLFAEMRAKGLEPLDIWLNGPRDVGRAGAKPILTPEDMQGVKIRVAPGGVYVDTFREVGANVTTMSWGSVPTVLRQGVIDAVEPTPNAWVSSHLYEIAQQITKTEHIWDFYIVTANRAWWNGLPAPTQKVLREAMNETTKWNWENTNAENERSFGVMRNAGAVIYELSPEQKRAWAAAMRPMWNRIGDPLIGQDAMAKLITIGEKFR
jgi:C4-dicarboxylate-binding protein DctP